MSLRDLFREIKTEQSQEVFLPKTNSVILNNITEGNLDLHGVFPSAVDFVLQAKTQGITAVVTFKTPEEAAEIAKNKVKIGKQEILPKLLLDASGKKKKSQKGNKSKKDGNEQKKQKPRKKEQIEFEKVGEDGDFGKKIHLWKLTKNIKMKVQKNWDEIKEDAKLEVNRVRKDLLRQEMNFLRCSLKLLEDHKWREFQCVENINRFPYLSSVQKDALLLRLRDELNVCVQEQIDVIRKAKMPEGETKTAAKFAKEIRFLMEFQRQLKSKMARKKVKKGRKVGKTEK